MGRQKLREQIFLLLFRVEFNAVTEMPEQIKMFLEDSEVSRTQADADYITAKYDAIMDRLPEIDRQLNEKAENWDITRMGKVELTVLRLALYELLYDESVPAGVAINEAVELSKKFGQESSGKFVNAVLAKFV